MAVGSLGGIRKFKCQWERKILEGKLTVRKGESGQMT